jgi:hypothetical protein
MRQWINLFENKQTPDEIVQSVLAKYIDRGLTPRDINHGRCEEFANDLERVAPDIFQSISIGDIMRYNEDDDPTRFDEKLLRKYWPTYHPFEGVTWQEMFDNGLNWPGIHAWAFSPVNKLCYDAETPHGVSNPFDLSFFDLWKVEVRANLGKTPQG